MASNIEKENKNDPTAFGDFFECSGIFYTT
jgi:hypothetical protein